MRRSYPKQIAISAQHLRPTRATQRVTMDGNLRRSPGFCHQHDILIHEQRICRQAERFACCGRRLPPTTSCMHRANP